MFGSIDVIKGFHQRSSKYNFPPPSNINCGAIFSDDLGGHMKTSRRMRRGITPAILILALAFTAFADTVRLKDGGIIKGKVARFDGGSFVISVGEGSRRRELKFAASEVESIQFDAPTESVSAVNSPNQPASYKPPVSQPQVKVAEVKITEPVRSQPSVPSPQIKTNPEPARQQNNPAATNMKPVEVRVKVLADNTSNGWTNSGWVVKKGQRIRIIADDGTISLGKGRMSSASGEATIEDDRKLLKGVPTGALLAVIGDDNNDFIYIGSEREFTASRDGTLFLGINDGDLNDNSGAFNVKIEILPG
jgi:hypothetical protein